MRLRKLTALILIGIAVLTGTAFSAPVEDALSKVSEQSAYVVLKLEDAQAFLKWFFSRENIDTFMPLILASEDSNEILGAIELISAFAENTPLKSVAFVAGLDTENSAVPFFQMAFTVSSKSDSIVKKISDGSASAVDVAKLFLGNENPIATFAETMIKVEKANDNILKVDNELFMKAVDGVIVMGLSEENVKSSINALEHSDLRLFGNVERKFSDNNFSFFHMDPKAAKVLKAIADDDDDDEDKDDLDVDLEKYFDKPLNLELGFTRVPEKFTIGFTANWKEALKKEYQEKYFVNVTIDPVKGGYLNLVGVKAPLAAVGGFINVEVLKNSTDPDTKYFWDTIVRNLRRRFGISEDDFVKMFEGPFSITIGDNVTFETFKFPAIYTLIKSNPENVFGILSKSQHFHKIQDGILQIDSSLSPVPCLVENKGEGLGIHFAELPNIFQKPEVKPALESALNREAISLFWLDFEQMQKWVLDSENGVMPMVEPLARIMGYGEIFDAVKNVLSAELSVPSIAVIGDSFDVAHIEFNIAEINPANGLLTKLVNISRKFISSEKADKAEEKKSDDKSE